MLVALVALFWIAGAQAVHDEGVFELEGNATIGVDANNPANPQAQPPGGDDAENVFLDNDSADESTFIEDTTLSGGLAGAGDTILTGGGTKDINDFVPGPWLWKETAQTSVQDKDDIEHAFAAQYTVDKSGAGESCGSAGQVADCELLYFGADRFSNSGDSVLGFWFLKGNVQAVGPDAQGNGTFTGSHTARNGSVRGDILIVTDFRQGGKAPSIQVYEWVNSGGSASTHLDLVGGGPNPAGCTQSPPEKNNQPPVPPVAAGDNFCATANQAIITSPWEYEAKSNSGGTSGDGGTDTKYGIATYMEGGINLTALGFGDQCFNTFLAETRASHSVTATLSDFVIGGFGACTSGITTTPQSQTAAGPPPVFSNITTALSIGANARVTVRDNAVISVTGTDTFGGTVKFFLCGPLPLNDNTNCSTGGVQIGASAGETVTGASGTATVPSASAVLTSAGDYCWRAEYSGDSQKGVPASSDPSKSVADGGTRSECFQIDPLQPTLTTTGGPDVTLGNAITDTASLTGTAKQPGTDGVGPNGTINATAGSQANAGGTITWTLRGPDDCDDAGLTISGTNPVTVNGDNTSYGPVSATPTALGKYTWVATYSGNTPNTLGAAGSCPPAAGDGDEEIIVSGVATLQTRQRWLPNDAAQITSPAGSTLAGDVVFTLYNDGECGEDGGTAQYTKTVDVTTGTGSANSRNVTTDNTTFHVTANNDGTAWSWKVTYDDDALGDPDPTCETTTPAFTLTD